MNLRNEIHEFIKKAFPNNKKGYCWLRSKFGPIYHITKDKELLEMLVCVRAKAKHTLCAVHERQHKAPTKRLVEPST